MIRLVQLHDPHKRRRVAMVEDNRLRLLRAHDSIYRLSQYALSQGPGLEAAANACLGEEQLNYDPIHSGQSEWRLLPAFDHPDEPARCLVTGTGLTHRK